MAKTGAPLAIEGILAFFMEATFFAVMFFGWNKVSPKFHLASTWLTGIGATISAYYPSYTDLQSSLTIRNSSSSYFTLQVMSCVSLLIPFVLAYIVYAWRQMDRKKITEEEITSEEHKY